MKPRVAARLREVLDVLSVIAFAAAIGLPGLYHLAVGDEAAKEILRLTEWRRPAELPELSLATAGAFPKAFEAYLNDCFAPRPLLVRRYNRLRVLWLDDSPVPSVVTGKDGWLFTKAHDVMDTTRGATVLDPATQAMWRRTLEATQRDVSALGARYVFALAPNKHSVYPEHLPDRYARVGPSNTDVFMTALKSSTVTPVDLRVPLREAKGAEQVFYPLGTHWNERGAYAGYRALAKVLGFDSIPRSAVTFVPSAERGDNWAYKLQLEDLFSQTVERAALNRAWSARDQPTGPSGAWKLTLRDTDDPTLLVFHDSFGLPLTKWLSEHFSKVVYVHRSSVNLAIVKAVRPDVVLHIILERVLIFPPNEVPGR